MFPTVHIPPYETGSQFIRHSGHNSRGLASEGDGERTGLRSAALANLDANAVTHLLDDLFLRDFRCQLWVQLEFSDDVLQTGSAEYFLRNRVQALARIGTYRRAYIPFRNLLRIDQYGRGRFVLVRQLRNNCRENEHQSKRCDERLPLVPCDDPPVFEHLRDGLLVSLYGHDICLILNIGLESTCLTALKNCMKMKSRHGLLMLPPH